MAEQCGSITEARDCSFQNNTGLSGGGAIAINGARWGSPAHFVSNGSTFFKNQSNVTGGAIYSYGNLKMVNSTVHQNTAVAANRGRNLWRGGGIECDFESLQTELIHCTITDNLGGGVGIHKRKVVLRSNENKSTDVVFKDDAKVKITNTILFNNRKNGTALDISVPHGNLAMIANVTNSLIGVTDDSVDAAPNQIGVDPMLGPLAHNGGATMTRLPDAGSPCVDTGSTTNESAFDQRGVKFHRDEKPDIGATEIQE